MTLTFEIKTHRNGYVCTVARKQSGSEDPQDTAAARIAETALCVVLECIERDDHGERFLADQKLARRLGEEFSVDSD